MIRYINTLLGSHGPRNVSRSPEGSGVWILLRGYAWKLSPKMGAADVTETLDEAIAITGVHQVKVKHCPRLLSDNSPADLSGKLRDYLAQKSA